MFRITYRESQMVMTSLSPNDPEVETTTKNFVLLLVVVPNIQTKLLVEVLFEIFAHIWNWRF